EVAQVLGLAGGDRRVLEQLAGGFEAAAAGCAVAQAGDQALDAEPTVVSGPDAGVPVAAGQDVVGLGVLVLRAAGAREEHPLARPTLVVHDPARDRPPGLELDD